MKRSKFSSVSGGRRFHKLDIGVDRSFGHYYFGEDKIADAN